MIPGSLSPRWRRFLLTGLVAGLPGCGASTPAPKAAPTPVSDVAESATPKEIDQRWLKAQTAVRRGKWGEVVKDLDRLLLEFQPGDRRIPQAHLWQGEAQLALGSNLQAAREFRKTSDDSPNDLLAPEALLRVGDAYADLWRRPELDPSYGQTALATYQELLNRYPNTTAAKRAQQRIDDLQERFAYKEYKAGLYYIRLKAYDSAILYLKDVVATYPRATVAPDALLHLVQAYRTLGYKEDVQETCGYIRRFHPKAPGAGKACPEGPEAS